MLLANKLQKGIQTKNNSFEMIENIVKQLAA